MISSEEKAKAQKLLLDLHHFIIHNVDPNKGFKILKDYNPSQETIDYLLSSNPWLIHIFNHAKTWEYKARLGEVLINKETWN